MFTCIRAQTPSEACAVLRSETKESSQYLQDQFEGNSEQVWCAGGHSMKQEEGKVLLILVSLAKLSESAPSAWLI